jgi:hypothetical protein
MRTITNKPAATYPLSDDLLRELGAAVRKDPITAVQCSFRVDVALAE